jgi:hypothetical protein
LSAFGLTNKKKIQIVRESEKKLQKVMKNAFRKLVIGGSHDDGVVSTTSGSPQVEFITFAAK